MQLQVAGGVPASREAPVALSTPVVAIQLQRHLQAGERNYILGILGLNEIQKLWKHKSDKENEAEEQEKTVLTRLETSRSVLEPPGRTCVNVEFKTFGAAEGSQHLYIKQQTAVKMSNMDLNITHL